MLHGGLDVVCGRVSDNPLKIQQHLPGFAHDTELPLKNLGSHIGVTFDRQSTQPSTSNAVLQVRFPSGAHNLMHPSEHGDMLGGIGSASSLGSTASSVFSQSRKSLSNGLTPLTNHTDSSPQKGNSPLHSHVTAGMAAANGTELRTPVSESNEQPAHKTRPQMLPPPGKIKGYRAVWDPELDVKLSKEERKRATQRKKEFGLEVRYNHHQSLSLRKIVHMT
jgi:histone-lysine N-methyltransferase SETD1